MIKSNNQKDSNYLILSKGEIHIWSEIEQRYREVYLSWLSWLLLRCMCWWKPISREPEIEIIGRNFYLVITIVRTRTGIDTNIYGGLQLENRGKQSKAKRATGSLRSGCTQVPGENQALNCLGIPDSKFTRTSCFWSHKIWINIHTFLFNHNHMIRKAIDPKPHVQPIMSKMIIHLSDWVWRKWIETNWEELRWTNGTLSQVLARSLQ